MHALLIARSIRAPLALSLALLTSACAAGDPTAGTWNQPDAVCPLPAFLGADLNVDATLVLDPDVEPPAFRLTMDLEAAGLVDLMVVEGTYTEDGTNLTLRSTGFVIEPPSTNTADIDVDGSQCITLAGFAGSRVCLPSPQTNAYTQAGAELQIALDYTVVGEAQQCGFDLGLVRR